MRNISIRSTRHSGFKRAVGIFGAVALAACSSVGDPPTSPLTHASSIAQWEGEGTGFVRVCKAAGPTGTYTFHTSVAGGGAHVINFGQGPEVSLNFSGTEVCLNAGSYIPLGNDPSWTAGMTAEVTVAELVPTGIEVEKIEAWNTSVFPFVLLGTITGSSSITLNVTATSRIKILYYNRETPPPPPPPPGGEGCTPGYWKQSQHFHSWDAAGYSTTQTIGSVFSNASAFGLNNYTLLEGLSFEGGNSTKDAAKILLRAAIAAVLNSAHPTVDYAMSTADVVAAVNAALTSDDRNAIISLGLQLDTENNRGCELN